MISKRSLPTLACLILSWTSSASVYAATDLSSVPLTTYTATSSTDVKPNVMFILDDSGSMGWDYLPDWANDNSPPDYYYKNSAFNGIAYNPALVYTPPVTFSASGAINTTLYPSMTGVSAATGGNGSATTASPNWSAVPNDGFGIQSTGTSDLVNNAYSYTSIAGEYCSTPSFRTCTTATAATTTYPLPAILRWCDSAALTTCKATNDATYNNRRMAIPRSSTITVSGSTSTSVTGITINSQQIMSGTATASTTSSTVATNIAAQINLCSTSIAGNCQVVGYTATVSGSKVTIFAPATINYTPVVTPSPLTGGMSFTITSFAAGTVPGENLRTTIYSGNNSYPYPGSASKGSGRTDCAGATCTYAEEMINYANWWAYYHTRMQMMKTAASQAFSNLDNSVDTSNNVSRFRVGYMSLNNNTGTDFVNLGEFKTTQKNNWYTKFLKASPGNSTPLRETLADAGRIYAGKRNGSTYNGVTVTDPLQFSCQANYTILSTDGFWNGNAGYKLDGSTAVGNIDGGLPRPYSDGATVTVQASTSNLQSRTVAVQNLIKTSSLQKQISQYQKTTSNLQSSTAQLQISTTANGNAGSPTWSAWANTTSCTWDTSGNAQTRCQYLAYTAPSNVLNCTAVAKGTNTGNNQTWSGPATTCSYTAWSAPVGVSTCTNVNQSAGPTVYAVGTATQCNTVPTTPYTNVASCTVASTPDVNGYTTQCQYTPWPASWSNTATCTITPRSVGPNYTVSTAIDCSSTTTYGTWTNAASCTISSTLQCQYTAWSAWSNVGSCTPVTQSSSPNFTVATARQCQTAASSGGTSDTLADVAAYYYGTDLRSDTATGVDATGTCVGPIIAPATTANNLCNNNVKAFGRDAATTQHMTTFTLGLGAQGEMVYTDNKYWDSTSGDFYDVLHGTSAAPASGICAWQTSGSCEWPAPASNSINNIDDLWHAAINGHGAYFSASDPKSLGKSLASTLNTLNNTPRPGTAAAAASSNPNISASDNFVFSSSYKSVEWYGELIRQQLDPANATLSSPQWSSMTLLDCATSPWKANNSYSVGQVFSNASKCYIVAAAYVSGATFDATVTTAGVTTANVDTAKSARVVKYTTTGTGASAVTTSVDVAPLASRTIYTTNGSTLIPFTWSNLVAAGYGSYFTQPAVTYVSTITGLSQFCSVGSCLTAAEQSNTTVATSGAAGEALVNFLRGDRSKEGTFYRTRTHVLGDIVSSEGRYVKKPLYNYVDPGFDAYKTSVASRKGMVYVAANDGMLHAFDADSGQENWAYIPGLVLPDIYRLADINYASQHRYFVDGTPEVGEICPIGPSSCSASQWKTILVGGLNNGGKGFYALDITDPDVPVLLWEISNATAGFTNLGYSYSNPRITKLKDGRWVVMFASGYNNADGHGHVYIVNAATGALIRDMDNNSGSNAAYGTAANPSGLARISAHVPTSDTNNTTMAVYGGDLLGNLWRFDINNDIGAAGYDAQLLVTLKDSTGTAQPITDKPTLTSVVGVVSGVATTYPVVFVGTGRYLGVSDVSPPSTQVQSFYGIKDNLGSTTYSNPQVVANGFIRQVLLDTTCPTTAPLNICSPGQQVRTITSFPVDWGVNNGWYFNFPSAGERAVTDSSLGISTLVFTTITPSGSSADVCGDSAAGSGSSFACAVDYLTGGAIVDSYNVACVSLGAGVATRPVLIELPDGTVIELIREPPQDPQEPPPDPGGTSTGGTDMGDTKIVKPPVKPLSAGGTRRVSWRKLSS